MKIKISKFLENGSIILLSAMSSSAFKSVAKNYSLIEPNHTSFNSLPAFCIGLLGACIGYMISKSLVEKLKSNENSIFQFDSNAPTIDSNVANIKDWHFIHETKTLSDIFNDETFSKESSAVIPLKKPKLK